MILIHDIENTRYQIYPKTNLFIFLILVGSSLLPRFPFGTLELRISDFISLLVLPLFFVLFGKIVKSKLLKLLFLFYIAIIISTAFGYTFHRVPIVVGDINEIVRMSIPLFILWACNFICIEDIRITIIRFFKVSSPLIAGLSFLQVLIPKTLPLWLLNAYGGKTHVELLITRSSPRIFATGSDPNIGGAILLLFLFFHIISFFLEKRFRNIVWTAIFLFLLGVTSSRTGLAALVFVVFIIIIFYSKIKPGIKILLLCLTFIFLILLWYQSDYVRIGFLLLLKGENRSWLMRIDKFQEAVSLFKRSPLLGWGPAKAIHTRTVDGEYFLLLRRYGLVGLSLFLIFFFKALQKALKIFSDKGIFIKEDRIIAGTFTLYSLAAFILMITNNFFSGYQLVGPYMVLLGFLEKIDLEKQYTSNIDDV